MDQLNLWVVTLLRILDRHNLDAKIRMFRR